MFNSLTLFSLTLLYSWHVRANVPVFGQCGGIGYMGDTICASGLDCVYHNEYYSQCLPRATPTSSSPTGTTTTSTTTTSAHYPAGTGLNGRFVAAGKLFWGTCADTNTINISANVAILKAEFGCVTPESSMMWDVVEPNRGGYNFAGADALINWAIMNGKMIRGQPLVWHSRLPSWVSLINDRNTLTSVIQNHIANLAGRYRGKIYAWDVVNEIFNEDGSLRSSVFSNVFQGDGFVNVAFQAARQADPNAKLYINDYNLDSANAKVNGLVNLVKKINSGSTKLIDGCGTQMHLQAGGAGGAQAALTALAGAGCDVAITELDIGGAAPNDYLAVLRACLNTRACVSITSWGISDVNSWRSSSYGLLWDANYRPKPAYYALISALPLPTSTIPTMIPTSTPTPTGAGISESLQ